MKQFELVTEEKRVTFNFPTSLSEISVDYLKSITDQIKIAPHYSLVGIVYHEPLGHIILGRKQARKNLTAAVVPIFIKAGETDSSFIQSMNCKDKIVIPSSQLSLGYHVATPKNTLSLDYFIRILDNDNTVAARYANNYGKEECFFIEFKLVPNVDIIGYYDETSNVEVKNPYIAIKSNKTLEN